MADVNKAIKPAESTRIAPLNDGALYQANKEIKFRLGAGLDMFLVNKSFLTFDVEVAGKTFTDALTNEGTEAVAKNFYPSYIRNANNIFRTIEVYYGGDCIYTTKTHNIHQNFVKQAGWADDYLDKHPETYATTNMINRDGTAYLKLENAHNVGAAGHLKDLIRNTQTLVNVQIPLNQVLPYWMDVGSDGFPMRGLNQQIEVRLYIANPDQYIVDYNGTTNDFVTGLAHPEHKVVANAWATNAKISDRFETGDITLKNVYIYANYYTPDANEAAIIDAKCRDGTYKLKYNVWEFDERQVDRISTIENIPMSVVTSNTKSILVWCYRKQTSPSVTYKPNIHNFQLKFTPHVAPLQPIAGTTMETPHEYKFQIDDVLNNIDTYFTETNSDYNRCYQYEAGNTLGTAVTKPSSTFFMFGMNYTSDPTDLGADSSDWNSQYQLNFNALADTATHAEGNGLQYVIAVNVECGLIIKNNKIFTFTL